MTMQRLQGFREVGENVFIEEPGYSRIRHCLFEYYSSPEMGRASLAGIMSFKQKLAMLKYLERFSDLTVNPVQLNWK
jgi:hypothetical protein